MKKKLRDIVVSEAWGKDTLQAYKVHHREERKAGNFFWKARWPVAAMVGGSVLDHLHTAVTAPTTAGKIAGTVAAGLYAASGAQLAFPHATRIMQIRKRIKERRARKQGLDS